MHMNARMFKALELAPVWQFGEFGVRYSFAVGSRFRATGMSPGALSSGPDDILFCNLGSALQKTQIFVTRISLRL
jgi:hypothetical protein